MYYIIMMEEEEAKQMSQYQLQLKLDRMTQRAFGDRDKLQKAPKKPLSVVDVEVIKEYQKQFNEPVKEYETEIDEETGEERIALDKNGKPKFKLIAKKFRVVPPPELDVVDASQFYIIPTDEEKAQAFEQMNEIKTFLEQGNRELQDLLEEKKRGFRLIDELPQPRRYVERLDYDERKKFLLGRIQDVDDDIADLNRGISELTVIYNNFTSEYQNIDTYKSFNDAEVAKVKKINSDRIKNYQDTLNLMNKGAFQQDQMPGETEEEYVGRLQANAEEEYVDETKEEALLDIKRRFKEALKKLVRDDIKIEQVANRINVNELETKNEILKQFPLFKRKFIDLYGLNNQSLEADDILTFIKAFVKSIKGDDALLNYLGVSTEKVEQYSLEQAEQDKNKVLVITNPANNRKLYWRIALYFDDNGEEIYTAIYSLTGKRESYEEYEPSIDNKKIKDQTGITSKYLKEYFENKPPTIMLIDRLQPTTEYDIDFPIAKESTDQENEYIVGWGIKQDEVPEIVPFGKIKIALNKLFYKNILSARHNNLGRIAGFQNVKVSDEFVAIIMKLIRGEKVIKQEIDALQKTEQMLYDTLLSLANLHKKAPNNKDSTIRALKERMDLIGGEIDAGNDNKALVKELYNIVHALKNFGVITNKEATKYLSQF